MSINLYKSYRKKIFTKESFFQQFLNSAEKKYTKFLHGFLNSRERILRYLISVKKRRYLYRKNYREFIFTNKIEPDRQKKKNTF